MVIRCYATNLDCWDDGIGHVIAAESTDIIDKYVEHLPWAQHPYQTFYIETKKTITKYYGDIVLCNEIDN